jgi:hypothetical protein
VATRLTDRHLLFAAGACAIAAVLGFQMEAWTFGWCRKELSLVIDYRLACGIHVTGSVLFWLGMLAILVLSARLFQAGRRPALSLVGLLVFGLVAAYGYLILFQPSSAFQLRLQYGVGKRHFFEAELSGADLSGVDLQGAYLEGAQLDGAILRRAILRKAHLYAADLEGVDLREANLSGADLRRARLRGADLGGADLTGADLRGADLEGASATEDQLAQATSLAGATLPDGTDHE